MSDMQPGGPAEGQPGQAAQGTIRLTLQGNVMTSGLTPTVHVSGHRVNARFGTMDVPVWAGRNRVDVHTQWMRQYGQASLEVDVPPGGIVPVHYAVPWHQFARGAIGTEKQTRPGLGVFALVMGLVIGLPLLVIVMAALAG